MAYCHTGGQPGVMVPQDSDSRDLDKVIARLPDGMRDRLKAAAERNKRSMNAEIVTRLAGYELLLDEVQKQASDAVKARGELESTRALLAEANHDRAMLRNDLTVATESLRNQLEEARREGAGGANAEILKYMYDTVKQMHEEDRAVLQDLENAVLFLETDRVLLEAELLDEPYKPAPSEQPTLSSYISKRLAWVADQRMSLAARLMAKMLPDAADPDLARRAMIAAHSTELSAAARELAGLYEPSVASNPADFVGFVERLMADAPDDQQATYKAALHEVLPRLFPKWHLDQPTDDDDPEIKVLPPPSDPAVAPRSQKRKIRIKGQDK